MSVNYDTLKKLQDVLAQVFIIEDRIREIPRDLEDKQIVLQKTKINYLDMSEKCDQVRAELEELNRRYIEAGKEREARESAMESATLVRESENNEKEIRDAAIVEQTLFKNKNAKQKYLADLEAKLAVQEEMVKAQEDEVNEEIKKKDSLIAEQQEILDKLNAERAELSKDLPANLLFKFERIIRNKAGLGVVPLHGIICQGCFMELPQQFANTVRRNEDINFCPYCSRVLYYEESDEDNNVIKVHGDIHTDEGEEEGAPAESIFSSDEDIFGE